MAISSKMGNPLWSKTTPLSGCFLPAYLTLGALAGGTVVDVTFPRPYFASNSALMVRELYGISLPDLCAATFGEGLSAPRLLLIFRGCSGKLISLIAASACR